MDEWDKGRGIAFVPKAKVQPNTKTEANTAVNAKAPEPCPA